MEDVKPGDVVYLTSGGPSMTVSRIDRGVAHLTWFTCKTDDTMRWADVEVAALTKTLAKSDKVTYDTPVPRSG